ncbi:MAG: hypothetical protein OXC80_04310 [Gammaproteobacteria bacterium]|nr:hypothetical protein [Gammaproteobacteria bacterium]
MIAPATNRIPNFAGVALVDILANGVAVLIIVVVLSIAEREEQEKQFTEKVKEVSAVMTREFSTSLVLNRLAASRPARLHDYVNSELDQFWDPYLLPIIEFHNDAIRDPYSGTIWPRSELLEKPNSFDDFVMNLAEDQATRLRGDIYDVGTYYLVNSMLRDYGIEIRHWHFIGSVPGKGSILRCPPDVLAQDCLTQGSNQSGVSADELSDLLGQQSDSSSGGNSGTGENWPPDFLDDNLEGSGGASGQLPNGATLGSQPGGNPSQSRWGSFPDANETRPDGSGSSSGGSGQPGEPSGENTINFRLADSREQRDIENAIQLDMGDPTIIQLLAGLMSYIDELQLTYDNELNVEPLLQNFALILGAAVQDPPTISERQNQIVEDLALIMRSKQQMGHPNIGNEPIFLNSYEDANSENAVMRIIPNRLIFDAETNTKNKEWAAGIGTELSPRMNINGHPGIWRGSQISLHRGSVLMVVPDQTVSPVPKWRAIVYIAPNLDDFIVGFVYSTIDPEGRLVVLGESNQVRLGALNLVQPKDSDIFGVRTWMFAFYLLLGLSFVGLLFFWRPNLSLSR